MKPRLLFADQLGPEFLDDPDQPRIIIESKLSFRKPMHFAKAQLLLSAIRHAKALAPERTTLIVANSFAEGLAKIEGTFSVCAPTSHRARKLLSSNSNAEVLPSRGFLVPEAEFTAWAHGRGQKRLVMEDFYRTSRRDLDIMMDGDQPLGGQWNFDKENRLPPPKGVATLGLQPRWRPEPDEIDDEVQHELLGLNKAGKANLIGQIRPRAFAVTPSEAQAALSDFIANRLNTFGPYEDAMMSDDWLMSHSALSMAMNLGLISPQLCIDQAISQIGHGAPLASVEGFVRQILGWREFVWHVYWLFGPDYLSSSNTLGANNRLPAWWQELKHDEIAANCLSSVLSDIEDRAWVHHIPRLMVLANWAMQRGYQPQEVVRWFQDMFVDGFEWVMAANVIGMGLYADGGRMSTKPYAAGGAYVKKMSNYCQGCRYDPAVRVGANACPFTAGYWWFLSRNQQLLRGNHRMAQPLAGLKRLKDLPQLISQEEARGQSAP